MSTAVPESSDSRLSKLIRRAADCTSQGCEEQSREDPPIKQANHRAQQK